METRAITSYQFTIDASIPEWLEQKRTTRSRSPKTITAYRETMHQFRAYLAQFGLDLLSNPIDIARVAPIFACTRLPPRLKHDGTPNKRHEGPVSNATYNNRLAILSSWYTFVQQVYQLQVPNPIKDVTKRKVQAYAAALPVEPDGPIWVSYSKQNKGEAISVQTLSAICRQTLGTSKNHTLRHSFAVAMIRSGAPITDLAEALGHTDIKITQLYAKEVDKSADNPYGQKIVMRFGIRRKGK